MCLSPVPTAGSLSAFSWEIKKPTVPCMQQRCNAPHHCLSVVPPSIKFKGIHFFFLYLICIGWYQFCLGRSYILELSSPGNSSEGEIVSLWWVCLTDHVFCLSVPYQLGLGCCCFPWLCTAKTKVHFPFLSWGECRNSTVCTLKLYCPDVPVICHKTSCDLPLLFSSTAATHMH